MHADNLDFKYTELADAIIRILYQVYNKQGYGSHEQVYEIAI